MCMDAHAYGYKEVKQCVQGTWVVTGRAGTWPQQGFAHLCWVSIRMCTFLTECAFPYRPYPEANCVSGPYCPILLPPACSSSPPGRLLHILKHEFQKDSGFIRKHFSLAFPVSVTGISIHSTAQTKNWEGICPSYSIHSPSNPAVFTSKISDPTTTRSLSSCTFLRWQQSFHAAFFPPLPHPF